LILGEKIAEGREEEKALFSKPDDALPSNATYPKNLKGAANGAPI
jgi:hypothetical protein